MSAPEQIVVIARWRMPEERVSEVLPLVAALRQRSLAEPGCLGYDVFRNTDDPGLVLLLERYRDGAAIEAHRNSLHYQELVVRRIIPMLSSREVELLRA
jgi:quinol monooxygenase YgiN